jgi:hypothetical protein
VKPDALRTFALATGRSFMPVNGGVRCLLFKKGKPCGKARNTLRSLQRHQKYDAHDVRRPKPKYSETVADA